ncbi:cyclophane-containing peptide 2OG-Fe(II) oxygenase YhhC [Spirosoma montaniterrae]|uniref:Prolyl 3,4-dihydroxylase TPA1/OFD1 N-terminal domain-containing protein n=1 Tax=Spirosoma montaniterrae TaxID=1178516 RepID=A0A1P9WTX4_9BACT|nr:cyclophane-containing peptide 2OG-Fe(II) oxygenase YhhC [Spirosoma montaniterrae]AQG78827.1 hypothetical protein AWR27_05515 [Spirosoma montaniterrae]
MAALFNLTPPERLDAPFPHVAIRHFLSVGTADELLSWFETTPAWRRHVEDGFYDTYDLDLRRAELPASLTTLISTDTTNQLRLYMEAIFGTRLTEQTDVMGHKLQVGQVIRVHSDYGPVGQTHRLVIQVNRHWSTAQGGILMLFDRENPDETEGINRYYLPANQSAVGFEISPYSHHAVSPIIHGDRYTLVYSFYALDGYRKFETEPALQTEAA